MTEGPNYKTISAEPEPSSMIETFRAVGYSLQTAVADIIDNSITANAGNIWIGYEWSGPETTFSITDDGHGMDEQELVQAMRPGSTNPLSERRGNDLGRFGLGLKTASFSQCRKFSVITKKEGDKPCFWCWDLDHVNQVGRWELIKYCPNESYFKEELEKIGSGTIVIWWALDRLAINKQTSDESSKKSFLASMNNVKSHLGLTFHRFIEQDNVQLYLNKRKIESWNPFLIGSEGLQTKPEAEFENGAVKLKGFILPHRSKLTPEEYENGKGPKGSWTAHQGFYVYRNKRLLVAGDWLGMFKKEVHYDLSRVSVDLTSGMDHTWKIDIKKSTAEIPSKLKDPILSLANEVRQQAAEVYRHKGKVVKRKLAQDDFSPLWEERTRHGKRFYKLNRNNPLIDNLLHSSDQERGQVEKVLQFIEETVPVPLISLRENEEERPHGKPFEGKEHESIKSTMKEMYEKMIAQGKSRERAKSIIISIEPFNYYPEYIDKIG